MFFINFVGMANLGRQCEVRQYLNISTTVSAGVSYDDPKGLELAKEIASKECLTFKGLYIHEGNAYNCAGEGKIKETTSEALIKLQIILNR